MHEEALEDHLTNMIDDYDVYIKDYCRMSLHLAENVLKMKIPLKVIEKDVPKVINSFYNRDKIYERLIMNTKIGHKEIDHWAKHVVELMRE